MPKSLIEEHLNLFAKELSFCSTQMITKGNNYNCPKCRKTVNCVHDICELADKNKLQAVQYCCLCSSKAIHKINKKFHNINPQYIKMLYILCGIEYCNHMNDRELLLYHDIY
ncbi:MAG: hypothetical protein Edafosvirus1_75 [Edafosvirus sp.]|uniref:Uncharacterized protein n=1 Tax=Edafosvirus sp. TaxID=2487765 RepID=A0A3G4ZTU1_9VIRU|nr:MAG: hypothetical protein Edafosvirus1_75 [Edafosvirus sp.]